MMKSDAQPKTLVAQGRRSLPNWAIKQRYLIDLMNRAAVSFVEKYTRPDGTLIWRNDWPGFDGSDDGYESFITFPQLYLLGGAENLHELARKLWNAVTWQFTEFGTVHREFDAYYDWMHHGESYAYIYYLGMANPQHFVDRRRALRFAAMYTGEDPEAQNWDPQHKLIRSPINGSKGPRFEMTAEDWVTLRAGYSTFLAPYEDIPGLESSDPFAKVDWTDDDIFERVLKLINERMGPGDVPINLNATSLVTSAFLYTGEEKYRRWVLEYLEAWAERTKRNNGIMPDNVGPSGRMGERMQGKWWGGYYGWHWPHGASMILEATLIAGMNATLLTGDPSWLDLHRSQADLLWSLRRVEDGAVVVPVKHGDKGWFDFRPIDPDTYVHLYFMSQADEDLHRLKERLPRLTDRVRHYSGVSRWLAPTWYSYLAGRDPTFPDTALDDTYAEICERLNRIDSDDDDVEQWSVHHWQPLNPVLPQRMMQMSMGTPTAVYHGGLLHASVRYFDPGRQRPGLPESVAALVHSITPDSVGLTLVNTDPLETREVVIQAGSFGEHQFTRATMHVESGPPDVTDLHAPYFRLQLGPSAQARIELGMKRFAHTPSYAFPPFRQEGDGD